MKKNALFSLAFWPCIAKTSPALAAPYAWGSNGNGLMGSSPAEVNVPTAISLSGVLAGQPLVSLANAGTHVIALTLDGRLYAWGRNDFGQLGDGTTTDRPLPVAVNMSGALAGKRVRKVDGGSYFTVVLTADGELFSWGYNASGRLGDGTTVNRPLPGTVKMNGVLAGRTVVDVSCGGNHTVVLTSDGLLYSWGGGADGRLGNGTTTDQLEPVAVNLSALAGRTVTAISTGGSFSMALTNDGRLYGWGNGGGAELGNGSLSDRTTPTAVSVSGVLAGKVVKAVSCGGNFTAALTTEGRVYTWGSNTLGQCGDTTNVTQRINPVAVDTSGVLYGGRQVAMLDCGGASTIALTADGRVVTWGNNQQGQLGIGSTITYSAEPVLIPHSSLLGGKTVSHIAAGSCHLVLAEVPPEISVEKPAGVVLTDGATTASIGNTAPGVALTTTFTVRNTGPGILYLGAIYLDGPQAAEYSITTAPAASLASGASTTFVVRFVPTAAGTRTAALHLPSTDADEHPFDVTLNGTGIIPSSLEIWRQTHFGTSANTGPAADNADPDKDSLENLVEFAFGLNPNTPDAAALPEWELEDDDYSLTFTRPPGVDGITYAAEYSTSMAPGSWTPAVSVGTPPAYQFFAPAVAQRQYVRVRVTAP